MKKLLALFSLAAVVAFINGCGGDKAALSTPEDKAAAAYIGTTLLSEVSEVGIDESASQSFDCPDGGTVDATASSDNETSATLNLDFNGCSVIDDAGGPCQSGKTITVDGDLTYALEATESTASMDIDGTLNFSNALDGSCEFNCTITVSYSYYEGSSYSWTGTICGESPFTDYDAWLDDVCEAMGVTATTSM
ncbi:MAG: hypothetical protein JXA66_03425 [Oligoflexia bacterium]|nr:hypothetical protein [Oligoflexia bacterium]